MKRVLLTGATGFIGFHCLPPLLDLGYEVHAVARHSPPEKLPDVTWHRSDLLETEAVFRLVAEVAPTHLLHLAWYVEPGKYWTSMENPRWVMAGLHLLQEFIARGGQRVVMAGTCAEYDWRHGYCSEAVTPLAPGTLYGVSKHSLQEMLSAAGKQAGLSTAWGRIFFLYGPREHPDRLVSSVVCSLLRGEPALCSHGNQVRDFLYVEDVAAAFTALLDSDTAGAVNIASGRPVTLKEVINRVADITGGHELVRLGARPAPPGEPPLLVADARRLQDDVGWQPEYGLDKGLEKTVSWWRKRLDEKS